MADGILDEAYERLHRTGPERQGWLSNHAPMAVEALARHGHDTDIHRWIDWYAPKLEDMPSRYEPIDAGRWRDALGDPRRIADWVDLLTGETTERPWRDVLVTWWPRLLPGIAAGATHGVIRVGHAVRTLLSGDESPAAVAELGHALAYWAARWQAVPGVELGTVGGTLTPDAALDHVPVLPDQAGGIRDRLARLDGLTGTGRAVPPSVPGPGSGSTSASAAGLGSGSGSASAAGPRSGAGSGSGFGSVSGSEPGAGSGSTSAAGPGSESGFGAAGPGLASGSRSGPSGHDSGISRREPGVSGVGASGVGPSGASGAAVSWPDSLAAGAPPDDPEWARDWLADLVDAAVRRYRYFGYGEPVMLVHSATAPNAVLRTLPALPPELWVPSVGAAWAASAAVTSVYTPDRPVPVGDLTAPPGGTDPVREVLDRAAAHRGEHVIKLVDTAVDVHARTGDPDALAAAATAIELMSEDS